MSTLSIPHLTVGLSLLLSLVSFPALLSGLTIEGPLEWTLTAKHYLRKSLESILLSNININ